METEGNCINCGHYSGDICLRDFPHLSKVSPDDTCPVYNPEDYKFNVDNKGREYNGNKLNRLRDRDCY